MESVIVMMIGPKALTTTFDGMGELGSLGIRNVSGFGGSIGCKVTLPDDSSGNAMVCDVYSGGWSCYLLYDPLRDHGSIKKSNITASHGFGRVIPKTRLRQGLGLVGKLGASWVGLSERVSH